jgi:hypothetical protein
MAHQTESPLVIVARLNLLMKAAIDAGDKKIDKVDLIDADRELKRVIDELSDEWTGQELITYIRTTYPVRSQLSNWKKLVNVSYAHAVTEGYDADVMFKGLMEYVKTKEV